MGVEYTYHNQFSVRGGYHYEHENKGNRKYFSFGAGFKMSVFSLDAAYLISTAQSNRSTRHCASHWDLILTVSEICLDAGVNK